MKTSVFLALSAITLAIATANSAERAAVAPQSPPEKAIRLPYGVEDVLKLSRAQISEEVIIKYVQNSGISYNLSPEVLVHLRNEGVPDAVLNTMLDQRKSGAGTTSTWTSQQPTSTGAAAPAQQVAPVYNQPPQPDPQPAQTPPSTVHVIPYYQATYASPYWYGYYRPYYGWYRPSISLGFSFGFGHGYGYGHCR